MTRKSINCVVMFADVVGSTTTVDKSTGDKSASEPVSNALNTVTDIIRMHKGHLVKTVGEEVLVYFTDVDMALLAAHTIQGVMEGDKKPETIGISIRIGMQFGSAILEPNDIFGDIVNVAARIASMAKAGQILCTKEMACLVNSSALSSNMRPFDRIRVKSKSEPLDIYILSRDKEAEERAEITNVLPASSPTTTPATKIQSDSPDVNLTLIYRSKPYEMPPDATSFILGRAKDCDVVVDGDLISRHHFKVERRWGEFIITDQSTNGTFIQTQQQTQQGQAVFLQHEEFALFGTGFISLGKKVDRNDEDIIQFYSE
jgi:adenylate cyclase